MVTGLIIYISSNFFLIDEGTILMIISCFGFVSVFYSLQIYEPILENIDNKKRKYNWN